MPTLSRRLSGLISAVVVAAAAVTTVVGPAGAAHADVSGQIRSAERALAAIQAQADALSARYVAAEGALGQATLAYRQAEAGVSAVNGRIHALQRQVGAFAAAAYRGAGNEELAVIASGSPQSLLDEVGALDSVARSEHATMTALRYQDVLRRRAQHAAAVALAATRAQAAHLAAARAAIEAAGARQLALLHRLQAEEAAIIHAERVAAARAAAQLAAARRAAALRAEQAAAREAALQQAEQAAARQAALRQAEQAAAARAAQLAAEAAATSAAVSSFTAQPVNVPPPPPPLGSGGAPVAVQWAYAEIGKPYVWGAAGPDSFDCSGLAQYVWGKAGVYLPHYTVSQYDEGPQVSRAQLQPGDLVFFPGSDGTWAAPGHVGIYVGGGMMIDAPYTGVDVREEAVPWSQFVGAVQP